MSYVATQRVIVRMLFDPEFRRAVYEAPDAALADIDLTAAEHTALVRPDPLAYGTDPFRRSRALQGLFEEYPVSCWLAGRALGDVRRLDEFFSSAFFHACIQERGSLADSFGKYLDRSSCSGAIRDSRVSWTATLERAIAGLRRRPPGQAAPGATAVVPAEANAAGAIEPETIVALSARHAIVTVAGGTSEVYLQVRAHLTVAGGGVVEALLTETAQDVLPVPAQPELDTAEALLLEHVAVPESDITIEIAHSGLAALLALAAPGATAAALWTAAMQHGATAGEAQDIVAELVADGLLVRCAVGKLRNASR